MAKTGGLRTAFIHPALESAELTAERVAKRGGHSLPLEDLKRRYLRSMNNLK